MTRFALEDLRSEVKAAVDAEGLRPFSERTDISMGILRSLLENRDPHLSSARKLVDAFGLELHVAPKRADGGAEVAPDLDLDSDDFVAIPRIDAEASAGPGAIADQVEVIGAMAFRRDWLRALGVDPAQAQLMTVRGDSMAPRIEAGDLVLVDRARRDVRDGRLYILTDIDGSTKLKRLQRLDRKTLALLSENVTIPTELRHGPDAARVRIHGQVMWWAHTER